LQQIESRRVVSFDFQDLGNTVGDEELAALAAHLSQYQPQVKVLRLTGDQISGEEGVTALARKVIAPNVVVMRRLYLHKAPNVRDAGAAALAQALLTNTSLRVLSLVSCGITSDGAPMLANVLRRNSHLQILSLQGNDVGDRGARDILGAVLDKPNPSITSLNLSHNHITDQGLSLPPQIAFTKLQNLFLSHNLITDAGALDLAKACIDSTSCSLRWMDFSCNFLTERGIKALQLFLPSSCELLSDNQLEQGGMKSSTNGNGFLNGSQ
jgi:NLR family CARD domain-containing protein 3